MPSNYDTFDVLKRNSDGTITPLGGVTINIWDSANNASLGTTTSDANGVVAAGTVSVPVGTKIIFRLENYFGRAGDTDQITT